MSGFGTPDIITPERPIATPPRSGEAPLSFDELYFGPEDGIDLFDRPPPRLPEPRLPPEPQPRSPSTSSSLGGDLGFGTPEAQQLAAQDSSVTHTLEGQLGSASPEPLSFELPDPLGITSTYPRVHGGEEIATAELQAPLSPVSSGQFTHPQGSPLHDAVAAQEPLSLIHI